MIKINKLTLSIAFFLLSFNAFAVIKTLSTSGSSWGIGGNWDPAGVPDVDDAVVIPDGMTVTISASTSCESLTFEAGSNNSTVNLTGGIILTVTNGIHFPAVSGGVQHLLEINDCQVICASVDFADNPIATSQSVITIGMGSLAVTGDITMNGSGAENSILIVSSGDLNIEGNFTGTGILDVVSGTGTVAYIGGLQQTVKDANYYDLAFTGTGNKLANGDIDVSNTLTVDAASTFNMQTNTLTGIFTNNGTGTLTTQSVAAEPIPAGITWTQTIQYSSSSAQTIVAGSYASLDGTGGNRTLPNSGTVSISETFTPGSGTYTTSGSTVDFNGTAQNIPALSSPYNNLTISNIGTKTMAGSVTTSGTLTLSAGRLSLNGNTLNLNGAISGSGTIMGSNTSSISIGGSGSFGTLNMDQTTTGSTNRLLDFTYNRAAVTITLGAVLEITGTVTPSAGILASVGNLTLVSDAGSTARIAAGSGSYITGNVTVQRFVPSSARRWRFMTSCMSDATLLDWQNEIYITGAGGATNGFDATLSNQAGVYYYDESALGSQNNGWIAQTNATSSLSNVALVTGRGYRVFVRGDRSDTSRLTGTNTTQNEVTMDLAGTVNMGDIPMPVTYTNSGNAAEDGWNLLGNPYPSQFDWNTFWDTGNSGDDGTNYTNIDATIYVHDASANSYKSYNALSNTGTITGGIIAQGQAFFLKATAASPALTFTESFKIGTAPLPMFKTGTVDALSIHMEADSINSDDYILKLMPGATATHDAYDIIKKLNATVNLSSYSSDTIYHTADVRPELTANDTVLLYVSGSNGSFTFTFNSVPSTGKYYYLEDTYMGSIIQINAGGTYAFSQQSSIPQSTGGSRFRIIISNSSSLPVLFGKFEVKPTADLKQVELNWSTMSEMNNSYFEAERSYDNVKYEVIGTIKGAGNSVRAKQYSYTDEHPDLSRPVYYRIKQVDYSNKFSYSNVRVIDLKSPQFTGKAASITLYPNPAAKQLNLTFEEALTETEITIIGLSGETVMHQKTAAGVKSIQLDISSLTEGIYFIQLGNQFYHFIKSGK